MNTHVPTDLEMRLIAQSLDMASGQGLIHGDVPYDPVALREERIAKEEEVPQDPETAFERFRRRMQIAWGKFWGL